MTDKFRDVYLNKGYFDRPGWLSPDGEYFTGMIDGQDYYSLHNVLAMAILVQLYNANPELWETHQHMELYEIMGDYGWVRVDTEYIFYSGELTDKHISGLYSLLLSLRPAAPMRIAIKKFLELMEVKPQALVDIRYPRQRKPD